MNKKEYVIFGAGNHGIHFLMMGKNHDMISAFVDNDPRKQEKTIFGIEVHSPEVLRSMNIGKIYISAEHHWEQIYQQLLSFGIDEQYISMEILEEKLRENNERIAERFTDKMLVYRALEEELAKVADFEKRWSELRKKYRNIKVYRIEASAIGELMTRYFEIVETYSEHPEELAVFLPWLDCTDRICNLRLIEELREKIYIPKGEDLLFWDYIYRNHKDELDCETERKYARRYNFGVYKKQLYESEFCFKDESADKKMQDMGIGKEFVCFAARTPKYNWSAGGKEMALRNTEFEDYIPAIHSLKRKDILAVRMGREEEKIEKIDNLIDYAGSYYDEYMDLYLASKCKALVCTSSGICVLAMMFSVPCLFVHALWSTMGGGGMRCTDADIVLPRKYFDRKNGRYLSYREMYEVDKKTFGNTEMFQYLDIEPQKNTKEEIAEALEELLARIDGQWVDTEEDLDLVRQYQVIYNEICAEIRTSKEFSLPILGRISTTYLRRNRYLIDG